MIFYTEIVLKNLNFFSECKPIQSLAFAKTHKSGSTTLQNIILRYGFKNDLTLALPTKGWMCDQKIPFNATTMIKHYKDNPSHLLNLFVSHSFWNLKEVQKIVGVNATVITILRNPLEVFESGYVYFGFEKHFNLDINQFATQVLPVNQKRPRSRVFWKNQLLYNLGMDPTKMETKRMITW